MSGADLVVRGRIATFGGPAGWDWVEALAIADGRVLAAGSRTRVAAETGPGTRTLDLPPDRVALPGLIDAHLHLLDTALAEEQVDLEGALTIDKALARVSGHARRRPGPDEWLEGGGWDPATLGGWPTAGDLERTVPGRRVALWSHDRHALWVSPRALAEAGIGAATPDPPGGTIRRDADGSPAGVLMESAVTPVLQRLSTQPDLAAVIRRCAEGLLRLGIVGVHDPGCLVAARGLDAIRAVIALDARGDLPIRVHASVRDTGLDHALGHGWRTGQALVPHGPAEHGRARFGWLKLFADGALGSRTALLDEPYAGTLDERGVAVTPPAALAALATRAAEGGIVPMIHAIGDAALRTVLDVLGPIAPPGGPMARVEHVQLAGEADLPRFEAGRIAASVQPVHLRTDRDKAHAAWGRSRAERDAFRLRSLVAAGAVVAFGTDAPVEPPDPWPGIALAVTRTSTAWSDRVPFGPAEAIDLAGALRAASLGPALVAGEGSRGRLVPGSPADVIVIPAAAVDEPVTPGGPLETVRPDLVLLDGRIAFEA